MAPINKKALMGFDRVRRVHHKYYDTTNYIAVIVTILLVLQIWWMSRGHG